MKTACRAISLTALIGALGLAAACGPDGPEVPETPDGFERQSAEGVTYAVPSDFATDRAQVDVMLAGETVDSAAAVGGTAQAEIKLETGLEYIDKDWEYEVPGVPEAERYDYTYEYTGGEAGIETVRGTDIALKLEDGSGVLFRLTGDQAYLEDELVTQITESLHAGE
ncbi:hypothetical protein [Nocardiopsis suaedae]|uniref:DUF4367 domain-containing protein n=1 Tax=Nocardiopsis suaedae TaxID=3018444 RepID=A0ABT4TV70_9ACTN|nr:hypothetical protein [Nocardiopsis suaedae]MDA2808552.1 hypothetical protein [Nocardiopsis suaedae]